MHIFELCGTPCEENFPGVAELPHFTPNFPKWRTPKFDSILEAGPHLTGPGLDLVKGLLRYPTAERFTPRRACRHEYFSSLNYADYDTGFLESRYAPL
jgi:hypothetical protein